MTLEVANRLDEILRKLEKLDTIEATLKYFFGRLAQVESLVENMKAESPFIDKGLASLNDKRAVLRSKMDKKDSRTVEERI